MSEEIIDYSECVNGNWFKNKWKGLKNHFYRTRRKFLWGIHRRIHRIEIDYSKIPYGAMPVLINNFNRLDLLKKQVDWLLNLEDPVAIIIVDNKSTLPPLLEYYEHLNHHRIQVVKLNFNSWRNGVKYLGKYKLSRFKKFVITDVDLLPYPNTPKDLISHLSNLLDRYPTYNHVGTSLEINDLSDHYPMKPLVLKFEKKFWPPLAKSLAGNVFVSAIDTTFAMYRTSSDILRLHGALRTDRPYTLKHVDWYLDPKNYSPEYIYYLESCKPCATWAQQLKKEIKLKGIWNKKKFNSFVWKI